MSGKTALVTGATGGLGTHVTQALLDAGFAVVGLAPKIQQSDFDHSNFTALPAALDGLDAAKKAADTAIARFGRIDVLAHLVGGFAVVNPINGEAVPLEAGTDCLPDHGIIFY